MIAAVTHSAHVEELSRMVDASRPMAWTELGIATTGRLRRYAKRRGNSMEDAV
jgi:hypothetical protein